MWYAPACSKHSMEASTACWAAARALLANISTCCACQTSVRASTTSCRASRSCCVRCRNCNTSPSTKGSPSCCRAWSTMGWYGCPYSKIRCRKGWKGDCIPSRGQARNLTANIGCPLPMVRWAWGLTLSSMNHTYLALPLLLLAS